ncbi:MAG: universal stress protein [Parvularculaceae bacterium]
MPHDIKSLLTMLNRPDDMAAILGWASRIAKDFDATADGVFLKYDLAADTSLFVDGFGFYSTDIAAREIAEASARAEEVAREEFDCAAKRGARSRMGRLQVISNALRSELAKLSRQYDLALTHLPEGPTLIAGETVLAELLLQGGVPVFAVPRSSPNDAPLQTALVAWDGSIEASRAVRAALTFLKECRAVHVRGFAEKGDRKADLDGLARYLRLHGVEPDIAVVDVGDKGAIGKAILDEAERLAADLIVMGAFGHSPWREQLFGGATHDVVRASRKPLILAH